jgi:exopolysaccharide/PEP-CTERM locus tyrosine autokinase
VSIIEKALDKARDLQIRNLQQSAERENGAPAPRNQDLFEVSHAPEVRVKIPAQDECAAIPAIEKDRPDLKGADANDETAAVPKVKKSGNTEKTYHIHSIDWIKLQALGMLVPEMARSQLAEEYRLIKRPLLTNAYPDAPNGIERANLILVTSSVPGEGKTFSAVNLALSIAMERDKTVLLVDADVAKPAISRLMGFEERSGLIELLVDDSLRVSDVLIKTDIPNLSILPSGEPHQHSTELLASDAMKRLARELSERYEDRIVIFDSPPLLAATQAPVLATLVGQVVLVIESEITPQYIVQESMSKLESCKVVGCVLNKIKKGFGFSYYYGSSYGYGYGYGYYGQEKDQG